MADRLYGLPPADFTAARTAEAAAAKESGDVRLAREIAGLRKPTVSAGAVNRARRDHPELLDELLSLGEDLRAAWAEGDTGALAELTGRRGEVTGRLARLLREGLSGAAAMEVDQTLDAAVVDEEAAGLVRLGRLVKPLSYSGFGGPSGLPSAGPGLGRGAARPRRATRSPEEAERERQEAEERRARELAQAEADYQEWRDTLALAVQELDEISEKVAKLEKKLVKARKKQNESRQRVEVARREERLARQRLEKAH
ncbi:hypothetical protein ACIBEJ_38370 [Nonomuraea sp. NPDC050790]|uniref:hypothetical protein n=1 Tax=Nonomuraea sp. NPDC050790 TaxID=3364371 RepID=UPI0037B0426D